MIKFDWRNFNLGTLDLTRKNDEEIIHDGHARWTDRLLLYTSGVVLLFFIIWANFTTVDELIRGEGQVIPSSEIQIVQNLEGGIVEEFLVNENDVVEQNQLLLKMSNIQYSAEYQSQLSLYLNLQAKLVRLKAEAERKEPLFPEDLLRLAPDIVQREIEAFKSNVASFIGRKTVLEKQLEQKQQQVKEVDERLRGLTKLLALSKEELAMMQPLFETGSVSRRDLIALEGKVTEHQTSYNNLKIEKERTKAAVHEAQQKLFELTNSYTAQTREELNSVSSEVESLKKALTAYRDRERRTEVRSPVHGIVKDIKIKTIGGVVQPGEPLIEVVPLEDQLIVEASVSPSDIAFLKPNMTAKIKLTAYDYTIYGSLDGEVIEISADTLKNHDGASFYRVKVKSDEQALTYEGKRLEIIPGMVAQIDILTGKKTIMSYLLKPFKKTFDNAFHER